MNQVLEQIRTDINSILNRFVDRLVVDYKLNKDEILKIWNDVNAAPSSKEEPVTNATLVTPAKTTKETKVAGAPVKKKKPSIEPSLVEPSLVETLTNDLISLKFDDEVEVTTKPKQPMKPKKDDTKKVVKMVAKKTETVAKKTETVAKKETVLTKKETCFYILTKGDSDGTRCSVVPKKGSYCSAHAKYANKQPKIEKKKLPVGKKSPSSAKVQNKLILKMNPDVNALWDPDTTLVFESALNRQVIGKVVAGVVVKKLNLNDLQNCKIKGFRFDPASTTKELVKQVFASDDSSTCSSKKELKKKKPCKVTKRSASESSSDSDVSHHSKTEEVDTDNGSDIQKAMGVGTDEEVESEDSSIASDVENSDEEEAGE